MAIVIRSERKFNSKNETDKIGPGEYFETPIPLDKELEENLIPFNRTLFADDVAIEFRALGERDTLDGGGTTGILHIVGG